VADKVREESMVQTYFVHTTNQQQIEAMEFCS